MIEVLGTEAFEVIRPYIERVLGGERVEFDVEVPIAGSEPRFFHVVDEPWFDSDGEVTGWMASVSEITDLRRTTKALGESEERLRLAMSSGNIGFWDWDVVSERVTWSRELEDVYGWDHAGTEDAFSSRVHPDDLAKVASERDAAIRNHQPFDLEFRIVRPSGEIRWLCSRGRGYYDEKGNVVRVLGNNMDITERVQTKEALRESKDREAFLLRLTDTIQPLSDPQAIQEVTARLLGEYLQVNRVDYTEIEGTDYIMRVSHVNGVAPIVGRGSVAAFGAWLLEAYRSDEPIVVNDVHTDPRFTESERAHLRASDIAAFAGVMIVKDKQWVATFGVNTVTPRVWAKPEVELIRNVSERIWQAVERARAEQALRLSEQKLRLGLLAGHLGTWQYDFNTGVFYGDDAVGQKIHGFDPPEVIETLEQAMRYVHPEDVLHIQREMEKGIADGASQPLEYRVVLPTSEVRWIMSVWMRQPGMSTIIGVAQDITERKRAELDLRNRHREQEHTLQLLLETAPQGILSVDSHGVIMTANRALEAMFGWNHSELIGLSVDQLLPPALQDQHAAHRAAYFGTPQPSDMGGGLELVGQRKDGSTFPIEVTLIMLLPPTADGPSPSSAT
jgi:PAS domain S-box-containing protein